MESVYRDLKHNTKRVGKQILSDRWDDVNVHVVNVPSYRKVVPLPSTIKLKITGGTEILSTVNKEDFTVSVDYNQYRPGNKLFAKVSSKINIKSIEIEPNEFELII